MSSVVRKSLPKKNDTKKAQHIIHFIVSSSRLAFIFNIYHWTNDIFLLYELF